MTAETSARLRDNHEDIIRPMIRERRFAALHRTMAAVIADEKDCEFAFDLMAETSISLRIAGEKTLSLAWARRITEKFNDSPFAWTDLARWYWFGSPSDPMRPENMRIALGHYETALARARTMDKHVRYILFDMCRLLTDLEDYPRLAGAMRDILDDLNNRRDIDIPRIKGEWLKRLPEGALAPGLIARYRRIMAADAARNPHLGFRIHPATLDELER